MTNATATGLPVSPDIPWQIVLDGKGGGELNTGEPVAIASTAGALTWLHRADSKAVGILAELLAEVPQEVAGFFRHPPDQPRLQVVGEGLTMTLRGVEYADGAVDLKLPSLDLWVSRGVLITVGRALPNAVREIAGDLASGVGPVGAADLLGRLALLLVRDLGLVLDSDSQSLDALESLVLERKRERLDRELNQIRLRLLRLHRHLSSQRTVLHELLQEHGRHQVGAGDSLETLREASERVEDRLDRLDDLREHSGALQDALADLQSQRMNNALYLLSLYTALFLPMGVLTGLLGINVGGMPGDKNPVAFWVVVLILVVLGVVGYLVFIKLGLMRPVDSGGGGSAPDSGEH